MWDFSIGRTLGIVLATWPYVLLRIAVYTAITFTYFVATGVGAGVGYGVGHIAGSPDSPAGFAVWGGIFGFGLVSLGVFWIREYILYGVKAGHVAVMAHLIDGRALPGGAGQLSYGRAVVTERFLEVNVLFVIDQLVKGVIATIGALVAGLAAMVPLPGLQGLMAFVQKVVRMSLTYVDEVVLAYNIRTASTNPWETAQQALVLYAQNGRTIAKNAVWLTLMMWVLTVLIFAFALAPAAGFLYALPGQMAGWSFVLALVVAWAFKAAILEPFCIAALMQVYFRAIEGQKPDPAWTARLYQASRQFRALGERAPASVRSAR